MLDAIQTAIRNYTHAPRELEQILEVLLVDLFYEVEGTCDRWEDGVVVHHIESNDSTQQVHGKVYEIRSQRLLQFVIEIDFGRMEIVATLEGKLFKVVDKRNSSVCLLEHPSMPWWQRDRRALLL